MIKTGERSYCIIAEWDSMDAMAAARPHMIATLNSFRHTLEDLGGRLGVINISSVAATSSMAEGTIYAATKSALDTITRTLASELGPRNIRVNAIAPGAVETEGVQAAGFAGSDFQKQIVAGTPLGRLGEPDDIARVAVFLASDASGWMTGERLPVSGGFR